MHLFKTILITLLFCNAVQATHNNSNQKTLYKKFFALKNSNTLPALGAAAIGAAGGITIGAFIASALSSETMGETILKFIGAITLSSLAFYKEKELITQTTGAETIYTARTAGAIALLLSISPSMMGTTWGAFIEDLIEDLGD